MGFRGEALSSISLVASRLTIKSKKTSEEIGYKYTSRFK